MAEHRSRFRSPDPSPQSDDERRNHYRVDTDISVRIRRAVDTANDGPRSSGDPVEAFEQLASAAARYRKELSGAGRQFVDRLMATMDTIVGELSKDGVSTGWTPKQTANANVSAGGLGFLTDRHWNDAEAVEIEFSVLSEQSSVPFRAQGVVRRCAPVEEGGYHLGIEFDDMAGTTRERLIRLVFDLQRVQLRSRKAR
jgi:hypothetical protein